MFSNYQQDIQSKFPAVSFKALSFEKNAIDKTLSNNNIDIAYLTSHKMELNSHCIYLDVFSKGVNHELKSDIKKNSSPIFNLLDHHLKNIFLMNGNVRHIQGINDQYDLILMPRCIENNKENARKGNIYLAENGYYVVRDTKGVVQEGYLDQEKFGLFKLTQKLNDAQQKKKLKKAILERTAKAGHTLNHRLSFNPAEILQNYRLVCKRFQIIIDDNYHDLGLSSANQAQILHNELKDQKYHHLSSLDFFDIKYATMALIAKFSFSHHHYISLGNSPTTITTYLQIIKPQSQISHLPMGDIKIGTQGEEDWVNHSINFIDYFDEFLENALSDFLNGKDIVVIDYMESGLSLRIARDHIVRYIFSKTISSVVQEHFNRLELDKKINLLKQSPEILAKYGLYDSNLSEFNLPLEECFNKKGEFEFDTTGTIIFEIYKKAVNKTTFNQIKKSYEDQLVNRVKIFFLSPNSNSKNMLSFQNIKGYINLPEQAKGGLELKEANTELPSLLKNLRGKLYKHDYKLTLFKSKKYSEIKIYDKDNKNLPMPTFAHHLRLTSQLAEMEKLNEVNKLSFEKK